jgi:hypothetical protein
MTLAPSPGVDSRPGRVGRSPLHLRAINGRVRIQERDLIVSQHAVGAVIIGAGRLARADVQTLSEAQFESPSTRS